MLRFTVQFDASAYRAAIVAGLPNWLTEPLRKVRETIIRSLYETKSGRPGPFRRRSARGEAPASQTKRLERSISQPAMIGATRAEMRIAAPYAAFLNDPAVLDRPFVEPAIERTLPTLGPAGRI